MTQSQRQFLIDKISKTVTVQIKALEESRPKPPNLSNYLLHAVMSGTFEIITTDQIKELIKEKALSANSGENWLESRRAFSSNNGQVCFEIDEFFIVPPAYTKLKDEYRTKVQSINATVAQLNAQLETLTVRIQLASPATLQQVIKEVDDMGNLSLFDDSLKRLIG